MPIYTNMDIIWCHGQAWPGPVVSGVTGHDSAAGSFGAAFAAFMAFMGCAAFIAFMAFIGCAVFTALMAFISPMAFISFMGAFLAAMVA